MAWRIINCCLLILCGLIITSSIFEIAIGGLVFEEPETINLSFTIRSFLPITCAPSPEIDRYWPGPPAIISREKGCPLKADRAAGTILAHPDFQIGLEVWLNLTAPKSYYWAPGSGTPGLLNPLQSRPQQEIKKGKFQPVSMTNAITPLVEPYLEIDQMTGLGKPVYCKKARCGVPYHYEDPSWPYINEAWVEKPNLASLADESSFRVWYRDDSRYNRRVGISMGLNRTQSNVFVFDSANEPSGRFHPLDRFIIEEPAAVMPVTANQEAREGGGHKYWFTSECHSFFQYLPGKTFSFQGDDDFLAYINNRLVVDLSGMHEPYESSINLDAIANEIGLVPGQVYPLDIFHAERRMTDSNFKMTTNLVSGCTVLRVGLVTFAQNKSNNNHRWIKNVGSTVQEDGTIVLTPIGQTGMTGYAFHSLPQNVAQGFTVSFTFRLTGTLSSARVAEGFTVVIHRDSLGISNMNGGSSGHLGARNFENSVVVAFDLCADRTLPGHYERALQDRCKIREVRVHRAFNGKRSSPASSNTMVLREGINFRVRQLVETRSYRVRIVYYGSNPNWLEVYIDDSLLMALKNFDVARDLGDRHAYIGLTSSTGHLPEHTAGIAITDWKIETIDIEPKYTQIVIPDLLNEELIADGKKTLSFRLDVKDGCNETVSYGGYGEWALAWLERVGDADRRRRRRRLSDDGELFEYEWNSTEYESINSTEQHVLLADVIDHQNGTYAALVGTNAVSRRGELAPEADLRSRETMVSASTFTTAPSTHFNSYSRPCTRNTTINFLGSPGHGSPKYLLNSRFMNSRVPPPFLLTL